MKETQHTTRILIYESEKEVDEEAQGLLQQAKDRLHAAYSPYSRYNVAAALLLANGEVVVGTNQENMAYPSGLCAERVAVFAAGAQFPGVGMRAMAIVASPKDATSALPSASCGACRQSMLEYELKQHHAIKLIMQGISGEVYVVESVASLLPLHFNEDSLKR